MIYKSIPHKGDNHFGVLSSKCSCVSCCSTGSNCECISAEPHVSCS